MAMEGYNILYPPNGRLHIDGGKNNKFERSIIADNESPDCQNVQFVNGAAETRDGFTKLNTISVGSFTCDGLYTRRANTGAETMVAFFGGSMWQLATTTFSTISSAQSVFSAGARVGACQYQNHMFIGNGGTIPYKYNGADFTRHGVYPPTTTMTAASSTTTGLLNGDYRYKVTFVNSQAVESDVGPTTSTLTVTSSSGFVNLTSIPVAPQSWGIGARRIYRTNAGGSTYFRITEIADNTTTTFTDNVSSSAVSVQAPLDNGVPPNYSTCIYHANRVFTNDAANPNFVWYSNLEEPFTYASTNFGLFGDGSLDLVKGFAIFDNSLIVFCENSEWLWYMGDTDPSQWVQLQIRSSYGSKSPFGAIRYQNQVLFPATQNSKMVGFAAVSGQAIAPSASLLTVFAAGSEMQSDRIEPDVFNIQTAFLGNISSIVFNNRAFIAVTYGANNTINNRVYVFDFTISDLNRKNPAWVPYLTINASQFTVYGGSLYFGCSDQTGFVHKLGTGNYNDNGFAIDSYLWTKEFSGLEGHENLEKDFREVNLLVENAGAYFMNVGYRVDSDTGAGTTTQIDLNPGSAIWNAFTWGNANWGGGLAQDVAIIKLGQVRGKRIQFRFDNQNAVNQKFKVHGLNFRYNIRGQR